MLDRSDATHCAWCGESLSDAEIFDYEFQHAGWREGTDYGPEYPYYHKESDREPQPICEVCVQSIAEHSELLRQEALAEESRPRFSSFLGTVLLLTFLFGPLLMALYGILFE